MPTSLYRLFRGLIQIKHAMVLFAIVFISACNQENSIRLYEIYNCIRGVDVNDAVSCKDKCIKSNGYVSVHANFESQSALILNYDSNRYLVTMDGVFETINNCHITNLMNVRCDYHGFSYGRQPIRTYLYVNDDFLKIKRTGRDVNLLQCGIN